MSNTNSCILDLDLDRMAEGLYQHLQDVQAAFNAIERIRTWASPQAIAGVKTVANLSGMMDPTGIHAENPLWANVFAILRNTGRPMRTSELAEIMRNSGVVTKSADFNNTLNTVMTKRQGVFTKISPNIWGLAEWGETGRPGGTSGSGVKAISVPLRPPGGSRKG